MSEPAHGREPLFVAASDCGHPEPPEPATAEDDEGWTAWDAWHGDHVPGAGEGGALVCELTPAGWYCPACTAIARTERDLPDWEHVECERGT
jgi:hypothetical protein